MPVHLNECMDKTKDRCTINHIQILKAICHTIRNVGINYVTIGPILKEKMYFMGKNNPREVTRKNEAIWKCRVSRVNVTAKSKNELLRANEGM